MPRVEMTCKGDCNTCELAISGKVDMIPCMLDQIFQRVQKIEKKVGALQDVCEKNGDKDSYNFATHEGDDNDEIPKSLLEDEEEGIES